MKKLPTAFIVDNRAAIASWFAVIQKVPFLFVECYGRVCERPEPPSDNTAAAGRLIPAEPTQDSGCSSAADFARLRMSVTNRCRKRPPKSHPM